MGYLRHILALLMLLAMAGASLAAGKPDAADTASAERFLRQIYSNYTPDGPGVPNKQLKEADVFDAALIALMKADQDAAEGEVGYLNGDPLCDCQDWGDIRIQTLTFAAADGDRLKASVTLKDVVTGEGKQLDLLLHNTAQGWRVEDFVNDEGSLAENLRLNTQELLQFKKDGAKP
ncbi:DUF3828 domain-containing protein [Pseudomonas sp. SCB32]|uniref:DUF3828 domain-containing protein n=1 Tax=Pseudomonas sp. SCB32 TaxID=2653853 RepID=UPI0012656371|nr:DUF3828 domain-containing protein [Pseudomonas sp. SCB32]